MRAVFFGRGGRECRGEIFTISSKGRPDCLTSDASERLELNETKLFCVRVVIDLGELCEGI